jgi:uncharacterized integral membrane protein
MRTRPLSETQAAVEVPTDEVPDTAEVADTDTVGPAAAALAPSVPSTRASRAWLKVLPGLILVAIIVMFVVQNLRNAKVSFATASGSFPLALALLGAAALGALSVLALGSVRILQLRKALRHSDHRPK